MVAIKNKGLQGMALGTIMKKFLCRAFVGAGLAAACLSPLANAQALPAGPLPGLLPDVFSPLLTNQDLSGLFNQVSDFKGTSAQSVSLASRKTTFSPEFLNRLALAESSGNADAQAKTSSACGLMQMTDDVLYQKLFEYGERYGYQDGGSTYIERSRIVHRGEVRLSYSLRNPADKDKVRGLCDDPYFATLLGAEHMRDVVVAMQESLKRPVKDAEAYMGYVFGPNAALRLVHALHNRREQCLPARMFVDKAEARANPSLFYHPGKHHFCVTVREMGAIFSRKMGDEILPLIHGRNADAEIASAQP
jgi:hypothetical protein